MRWALQIKEALLNLSHARLRTFLALLGIVVGTASVVAMVSGGRLATNATLKQIQSLGTDLIGVSINSNSSRNQEASAEKPRELSIDAALDVVNVNSSIDEVAPYTQTYVNVDFEGNKLQAQIMGTTESMRGIVRVKLQEGRFISFLDHEVLQCVIGNNIYQDIKKHSVISPVGAQLKLGDQYCNVVGVLAPWEENGFMFVNLNKAVILPLEASMSLNKYTKISNLVLKLKKKHAPIDDITADISSYISNVLPGANVFYRSPQQLLDSMKKQSNILTVFLGFIGGISLLVGGIGVMNIMLVSVMERKREIGIRLAVGARRRDIQLLFLIEALVLALVGGILGVAFGVFVSFIVAYVKSWEFSFFLLPPVIGFTVSVFVGIFFGFYPAYKASKLDPIEALRTE